MQQFVLNIVNELGYAGITLLIALENIFPPLPSEVILTFGGFLTHGTALTVTGVVLAATCGSLIGALALYGVGAFFAPEKLERWLSGRFGRWLGVKQGDITRSAEKFAKRGKISILYCRCIPILRSLISLPAGIARMKILPFFLLTAVGSLIWNTIMVNIGAAVGEAWEQVVGYTDIYGYVTAAVLLIIIITVISAKRNSRK